MIVRFYSIVGFRHVHYGYTWDYTVIWLNHIKQWIHWPPPPPQTKILATPLSSTQTLSKFSMIHAGALRLVARDDGTVAATFTNRWAVCGHRSDCTKSHVGNNYVNITIILLCNNNVNIAQILLCHNQINLIENRIIIISRPIALYCMYHPNRTWLYESCDL